MPNILIVEDHDDLREVVAHNVTRWGHRAIEAANANDALIELDDYAIDLILFTPLNGDVTILIDSDQIA